MTPSALDEFAVVVPTWLRAGALAVCLRALAHQDSMPTRVLVIHKADDLETAELLTGRRDGWDCLSVEAVLVPSGGNFLTQLNAGIAATHEPLVAMTDDDAEPHPDWLARMRVHFADPTVGGVGGRDWQPHERHDRRIVGTVSWFGRVTGNHHLGIGPAREVDLLKGVNWAFRGSPLRAAGVDSRLRGGGTVMNTEMAVCFALRRQGWRLVYDPAVAVEHHVAPRLDGDVNTRGGFDGPSFADSVHNETLALLGFLSPWQRLAFLMWAAAVGTSGSPGIAQVIRLALMGRQQNLLGRWLATVRGRAQGLGTYIRTRTAS